MTAEQAAQPWAVRTVLISVGDLDRSIAFYRELGPLDLILREDAVAVLGDESPASVILILRATRGMNQARHGQQSLGVRLVTFNTNSTDELDRIESVLRRQDLFTARQSMADGASELLRGRDPDNLPLVFVCYASEKLGADYYRTFTGLIYSMDA
jgi:catechol 2,3-dioxygenase-like lactoylglutathione lyase family enzyme